MIIGEIIKQYRTERGMSMQEFADMASLSKGYISMLEKGRHPQNGKEIIPSIETVSKLAKAMNVTIETLLDQTDPTQMVHLGEAPVYEAAAGEGRYSDGSPTDTLPQRSDDGIYVTVKGRSMEPTLHDGDIVVVYPTNIVESQNDIMLVKVNGEEHTLKHVKIENNGIHLFGENFSVYSPHFYTADECEKLPVRIIGIATEIVSRKL